MMQSCQNRNLPSILYFKKIHLERLNLINGFLNRVEIVLPKETFILPPEGQDIECDEKKLTEQVKKMAAEAAQLLTEKNKNGKVESQSPKDPKFL